MLSTNRSNRSEDDRFGHAWIEQFYHYLLVERAFSPRTADGYVGDLRLFYEFCTDRGKEIAEVDLYLLRQFVTFLQETRGNNERTRARKVSALRRFYQYLLDEGLIDTDPTAKLKPPKLPSTQPLFLGAEEARRFLDAVARHGPEPARDVAIFSTFLYTGCRLSELVALRVNDVDFETESIRFVGKGSKERVVPLRPELAEALEAYLAVRKTSPRTSESRRLFRNRWGHPITDKGVHYLIKRITRAAGFQRELSSHKLRHTVATLLLEGDADLRSIQELLGHSSVATTQRYTHVVNKRLRSQLGKLDF